MSTLIFDTHKFITNMTNVGMPQPQAEVLAESYVELMETTLATKQDLKDLEGKLTGKMTALEVKLTGEMQALEAKLTGEMQDLKAELRGEMKDLRAELTSKIDQALIKIIGIITAVMVGLAALMAFFMTFLKL